MKRAFFVFLGFGIAMLAVAGAGTNERPRSVPSPSNLGEIPLPKTWYFANGNTETPFETFLLIQNPNAFDVNVTVRYYQGGEQESSTYAVGAESRRRINCEPDMPAQQDFSIKAEGQYPVIVERPMYFDYRMGGSSAPGTPSPSRQWYFPYGSTKMDAAGAYQTKYILHNLSSSQALVQTTFYDANGSLGRQSTSIPPNSYRFVNTTTTPGANKEFSAVITSDVPVLAERAMYYNQQDSQEHLFGNNIAGAVVPSNAWYLAEGSTAWGFSTYICIQNPNAAAADVTVNYSTATGAAPGSQQVQVPPYAVRTVNPADFFQTPTDFSAKVSSPASTPVVVERAMYWNNRQSFHSAIGTRRPANEWYLAEGSTNDTFETYLLVQNPGDSTATVAVTYSTPTGSIPKIQSISIPPDGRVRINPNDFLGSPMDFGTQFASDKPVVVERAMYWSKPADPLAKAGHCAPGFSPVGFNVLSPNGGESFFGGLAHLIEWTSTGSTGNVKIEYSTNGGSSYVVAKDAAPDTGSYTWTIPNVASTNCLVRISEPGNPHLNDVSNAVFTITAVTPPAIGLSKTALNFGAVAGGAATKAQSVIVSNAGQGTLAWTAASDQTWLSVAPASGTGTGILQVSVNPIGLSAGLTAGVYQGAITVADPNASNSPQTIAVTLTVYAAGGTGVPFGDFATPINGTTGITGAIPVTGWVLDDIETVSVQVKRLPHATDPSAAIGPDGLVYIGDGIFVEGARPDVEAGYPTYPFNYRAGWGYMLLTNFLPLQGNDSFTLHAIATDKEGNAVSLGTKVITCDNAHATKPFGTLDTPPQGGDASGSPVEGASTSAFVNFGWVLTPMPKTVPKNGSTIEVYVDSVKVGTLATLPNVYDQYRVDVATAFPGLNNSSGPVGAFFLNTAAYANGVHTIYWIATDDAGAADGIGSRYFNIVNVGAPPEKGDTHFGDTHFRVISSPGGAYGSERAIKVKVAIRPKD